MLANNLHYDDNGHPWYHKDIHNMYGQLSQKATYKGTVQRDGNLQRVFTLTRSFYLGQQKYGAWWTGDGAGSRLDYYTNIAQILTIGLSGLIFGGSDVPYFQGEYSEEQTILGYQLGVFMPFMRAHVIIQEDFTGEPWLFEPQVSDFIHECLDLRYELFHYLYTEFYFSSQSGSALWKPLWQVYPTHEELWAVGTQFQYGSSLMIAPKGLARFTPDNEEIDELKDGFVVDVSLRDPHFEWSTGKLVNGDLSYRMKNDEWPIFVKQGSILTTMNVHDEDKKCLSLEDCWGNSITVKIYGEEASGHLYLDDGISLPVQGNLFKFTFANGKLALTCLECQIDDRQLVIKEVQICGFEVHEAVGQKGDQFEVSKGNENCTRIATAYRMEPLNLQETTMILETQ